MSVMFCATPRKDPRDQNSEPKYYVTVRSNGRVNAHGIARDISKMSTVSSLDTAAVLDAFINVVPDLPADGKIVELGDLGTFRVSVSSEGAETPTASMFPTHVGMNRLRLPPEMVRGLVQAS